MTPKKDNINALREAFRLAITMAGNVHQLSLKTGVTEASLNRYKSGKQDIVNAPFVTLSRLFPHMNVDFFGEKSGGTINSVNAAGKISGGSISQIFGSGNTPSASSDFSKKILKSPQLTPEEKIKFLEILSD